MDKKNIRKNIQGLWGNVKHSNTCAHGPRERRGWEDKYMKKKWFTVYKFIIIQKTTDQSYPENNYLHKFQNIQYCIFKFLSRKDEQKTLRATSRGRGKLHYMQKKK